MIHRWENGKIAFVPTLRYAIAKIFPFWDGDAPGRAYTPRERQLQLPRTIETFRRKRIED